MKDAIRIADDEVYLKENRYEKPKEITKFVVSLFEKAFDKRKNACVLDIACAAGEFLYYFRKRRPSFNYYGIDISEPLIEKAKKMNPDINLKRHSLLKPPYFDGKKFDVVFCLGTVSIFDDIETTILCILSAAKRDSLVYIGSIFNPHPVDALVVYRPSSINSDDPWQSGFNRFSIQTVNNILKPIVKSFTWYEHKMPFALKKQDDPMRSWTIMTEQDSYQRINGIGLLCSTYIVEIVV